MSNFSKLFIALSCLGTISSSVAPCHAGNIEKDSVTTTVLVKAKADVVWQAIRNEKVGAAFHRKVLTSSATGGVVQETFDDLPMIGTATCVINEADIVSGRRIDYSLVSSDKLKKFCGTWTLTPSIDGNETYLKLITYCDTGTHIPFARAITNSAVQKLGTVRLAAIKTVAEGSIIKISKTDGNSRSL